ncbi:hypothetical protein [Microcoleus sp.]|uniref:hypothetical protein n=1 Tax=Microcoleus sp. TaxID=44472 RepID=UPI0035247FD3
MITLTRGVEFAIDMSLVGVKEEGRRKKEEGRRKKEEGRRKKEEGRRKKEEEPPPRACFQTRCILD